MAKIFNPGDPLQLQRLYHAISWSRKRLEPFRSLNRLSMSQIVGRFYGENASIDDVSTKVPVNSLELGYTIYHYNLAGGEPRISVSSKYRNLRSYAYDFELAMNDVLREVKLADVLRRATANALRCAGPVKMGVEAVESIYNESDEKMFVDAISMDHWFHDMTADCWEYVQYMGNRYSMPLDVAKATGAFDRKQSNKLQPTDYKQGILDEGGNDRTQDIGTNSSGSDDGQIYDMVDVLDVWLPQSRMLVTIDADGVLDKPLRVVEWDNDNPCGPYEMLGFSEVDGNTMPCPPTALWMDLHLLQNNLFRKIENQAKNQRNLIAFTGSDAVQDAKKLDETQDGGSFHLQNPKNVLPFVTSKIDQTNLAFLIQLQQMASYFGGNWDALGGLGPQSPTLGQDELLTSAASRRLTYMQSRVQDFIKKIVHGLSYYEFTGDSARDLRKPVKGTDYYADFKWDAKRRKGMGQMSKYLIDVVPYSSSGNSPAMKLQGLVNVMQQFYVPLMPLMQQEGYTIGTKEVTELIARLGNLPELEDIIVSMQGPVSADETGQNSMKPSQTNRTYTRVNKPQSSRQSRDGVLMRALLGQQSQPAEAAKLSGAAG